MNKGQPRMLLSIEALESRTLLAADFNAMGNLLSTRLGQVQFYSLTEVDINAKMPLFNDSLAGVDETVEFFNTFRTPLSNAVKGVGSQTPSAIQQAIYNVVGPAGLDLLKDTNGTAGVDTGDVLVTVDGDNVSVRLSLLDDGLSIAPVTPGTALPGVPLTFKSSQSKVVGTVQSGYDNLSFGWYNGTAYFGTPVPLNGVAAQGGTLNINVAASLSPGTLNGTLGYFPVSATIAADNPSNLAANFAVPVNIAGTIGTPSLTGSAHLEFDLISNVPSTGALGAPAVKVHYVQDHDFGTGSNPNGDYLGTVANKPTVSMTVQVGVKTVGSDLLSPLADKIDTLIAPIKPVLDVLTAPLPVISKVSEEAGLGKISLIDVAKAAASTNSSLDGLDDILDSLTGLQEVAGKINGVQNLTNLPDQWLDFGTFNLSGNGDLRTLPTITYNYAKKDITTLNATAVNGASDFKGSIVSQLNAAGAGSLANFVANGISGSSGAYVGYAFGLPIFQSPDAIYRLLLGRNADLATFHFNATPPALEVELGQFRVGPIKVAFGANITFDMNVDLGYDGNGLRSYLRNGQTSLFDNFQGLYIGSNTRIALGGGVSVAAGPDVVVFSLMLKGGVGLTVGMDINDAHQGLSAYIPGIYGTDDDTTRVRQNELSGTLFDVGGEITASLSLVVRIGVDVPVVGFVGYEDSVDLGKGTLFSFDIASIPDPFAPPANLTLARRLDDGTLQLFTGATASMLEPSTLDDAQPNDAYSVIVDPNNPRNLIVSAYGYSQTFTDITGIGAVGGDKPMRVTIGEGINLPVVLVGGSNDDRLIVRGNGNAVLSGQGGDDELVYEGSGRVTMYGDGGNDTLMGGSGANILSGGADNDLILGGKRLLEETLTNGLDGGDGDDTIFGGLGNRNTIVGGAGNDKITAGDRGDEIYGDEAPSQRPVDGNDTFTAGNGNDTIFGGGGDDALNWSYGNGLTGFEGQAGEDRVAVVGSDNADAISVVTAGGIGTVNVNSAKVIFSSVSGLNIESGGGADTINLPSLFGLGLTNIGINLQDVAKRDNAKDTITVQGRPVAETVTVENEGVATQRIDTLGTDGRVINSTYEYGGITKVLGLSTFSLRVGNVNDQLNINTEGGEDDVTVYGITGPTTINTGADSDRLKVESASPTVPLPTGLDIPGTPGQTPGPRFAALLNLNAGAGDDNRFDFVDLTPTGAEVELLETQVASTGVPNRVVFQATGEYGAGIFVRTGSGKDEIHIVRTLPGTFTVVNAGANDDKVIVGERTGGATTLDTIAEALRIDGAAGNNLIVFDDSAATGGNDNVIVQPERVLNFGGLNDSVPLYYASTGGTTTLNLIGSNTASVREKFTIDTNTASLKLDANAGDDLVFVDRLTRASTINGGAGDDLLTLGRDVYVNGRFTGKTIADIAAAIAFSGGSGGDRVLVDDSGGTTGRDYVILASKLGFPGGSVTLSQTEDLDVDAGTGADILRISTLPPADLDVDFYGGGGQPNTVYGSPERSGWSLNGKEQGTINNGLAFFNIQRIYAGIGYDSFAIGNGMLTGVRLFSNGGSDTLDYSAWTTSVTVDLSKSTAVGLLEASGFSSALGGSAGDLMIGSDGRNTLVGNGGNDILVGLGSTDSIVGGNGHDVLIGGQGADNLSGQAGNDLLIDGTTAYDSSAGNLRTVLSQWTAQANTLAPKLPAILAGKNKLFHDNFIDTLSGGLGTDYFYASRALRYTDLLLDRANSEIVLT